MIWGMDYLIAMDQYDSGGLWWLAAIVWLAVWSLLARWVGDQKGRDAVECYLLGFLFGPLGVLIELLLPSKQ